MITTRLLVLYNFLVVRVVVSYGHSPTARILKFNEYYNKCHLLLMFLGILSGVRWRPIAPSHLS